MEEDNKTPEELPDIGSGSTHSTRTWRACCLAPTLAAILILLLAVVAGLYSKWPRSEKPAANPESSTPAARRETFVAFGRDFFTIAARADTETGTAFGELRSYAGGKRSIEDVHAAFRKAADANARASKEFRALIIPDTLVSQAKVRRSVENIAQAYQARKTVCEIVLAWNGDEKDQATIDRYMAYIKEVKRLTIASVANLTDAAYENGLNDEDIKEFARSNERATISALKQMLKPNQHIYPVREERAGSSGPPSKHLSAPSVPPR